MLSIVTHHKPDKATFGPDLLNLDMKSMQIEILDPKALKLIKEMEALDLITIKPNRNKGFLKYIEKLRSHAASAGNIPTLEEITKEVEKARVKRYAQK